MGPLNLTEDERRVLLAVLEDALSDLRMEIAGTDSMDFRDTLKARKTVLKKVIEALRAPDE